jgi:hypothetical protein
MSASNVYGCVEHYWKGAFDIHLKYGYQDCHYDKNRKNKQGTKQRETKYEQKQISCSKSPLITIINRQKVNYTFRVFGESGKPGVCCRNIQQLVQNCKSFKGQPGQWSFPNGFTPHERDARV